MHKRSSDEDQDGVAVSKRVKMSQNFASEVHPPVSPSTTPDVAETSNSEEYESDSESAEESETDDDFPGQEIAGIIQKISLTNFMCHDLFELELGPRLNFIIGRNGSGKSAVITGIAVGLGARATETNRGTSISDLIKDGKSVAKIKITFSNKGRDSFKPALYGDQITIERRLTRKVASSYTVRDVNGKAVSSKKSEVDNILARYDIRVDNPLAFLSQDKAREFLTTTGEEEKFKYFMAGIKVTDIVKQYEETSENLNAVSGQLDASKTHSELVKKKFEEATETYDKFRHSDQLRQKLQLLNGKIFWYNVGKIETTIEKRLEEIKSYEAAIENSDIQIATKTDLKDKFLEDKLAAEDELKSMQETLAEKQYNLDPMKNRRDQLKTETNAKIQEIKINKKQIESNKKEIEKLKKELQEEEEKLEVDQNTDAKRDRIKSMKDELQMLKDQRNDTLNALDMLKDVRDMPEFTQKRQALGVKETDIMDLRRKLKTLKDSKDDKLSAWNASVRRLVSDIELSSWQERPIGPLGSLISVKKGYEEWKDLLNAALQRSLNSFLVTNEADRRKLSGMMARAKIQANIISRKPEVYDYSRGMPNGQTTFIDVLEFSQEAALYALIDINSIERSVITKLRNERQLVSLQNVQYVYSLASKSSGRRTSGNANNVANDPVYYNTKDTHKFAASAADINTQIAETEEMIKTERSQLDILDKEIKKMVADNKSERSSLKDLQEQLKKQIQELSDEISRMEYELENGSEEALSRISLVKSQIQDLEENNTQSDNISLSIMEDLKPQRAEYKRLDVEVKALEREIEELKDDIEEKKQEVQGLKDSAITTDTEINNLQQERRKTEKLIEHSKSKIESLTEKLTDNKTRAEEVCERHVVPITEEDTPQSIQSEYMATQKAVEEAERTVGITFAEAQEQYELYQAKFEAAEQREHELQGMYTELSKDLNARLKYLKTTLEVNIKEAANSFEESLDSRNFKGKLAVDTANKRITMVVAPQDTSNTRALETLSGGEKSFTQIAFLLSIWRIMKSKVRGLDEFDVFMDSVNRTISIRLLLDELRKSPNSQTIFITPQDITNIANLSATDCLIHRMSDPRDD